jgi:hypothetical protein
MRPLPSLLACAAVALSAAGCSRPDTVARTVLDCPVKAGPLSRAAVAADGRSCRYGDPKGDQVELRLVALTGAPETALEPIERALQAEAPRPAAKAVPKAASDGDEDDDEDDDGANTTDAGARSEVNLPGLHITADDRKAQVVVGGMHVDASETGAVVRKAREVKMRGNPFVLERRGYRASLMIARDDEASGFPLIGYEAGGPKTGPLTVAIVHATGHDHGVFAQAKSLVRRNGGV